jgi:hypothetical protein
VRREMVGFRRRAEAIRTRQKASASLDSEVSQFVRTGRQVVRSKGRKAGRTVRKSWQADGLCGGLAKPRVTSSVVLSREGRKDRSDGAAMNRKVQRRCIRERRARGLRDIGETRRDWFLLAEEGLSPAFSGDSPRGFELRFASDMGVGSIRSGSDRRGDSESRFGSLSGAWENCGQVTKGAWGMSWRQKKRRGSLR